MKRFLRKFAGIICLMMCIGSVVVPFVNKSQGMDISSQIPYDIVQFCFFGFLAWLALSKPKNERVESNKSEEEPVSVALGMSILVYLVDAIIVIIAWITPLLIAILFNAPEGITTAMGLVGVAFMFVAICLLPGPKSFQRYLNKRKNQ